VALDLPDYEPAFALAIEQFWQDRAGQMARQRAKGLTDAGTRGSVTGGTHLHAVRDVIHQVIIDAGLTPAGSNRLPGFYRAAKNWDTVVMHNGAVLAIIELKSQVGSFGNNVNNRIEEMIGQSADIWKATRERLLGPVRPWFGYVMILEADEKSTRSQARKNTILPVDPVFDRASAIRIGAGGSGLALSLPVEPFVRHDLSDQPLPRRVPTHGVHVHVGRPRRRQATIEPERALVNKAYRDLLAWRKQLRHVLKDALDKVDARP
jgi:Restriction endonuclease XhoI